MARDGAQREIEASELVVGDIVRIRVGDKTLLMLLQEELLCEAILLAVHLPGDKVAFVHIDFTLN